MKKTIYPLPKESLEKRALRIFTPIKDKLCVTCMFAAGSGKKTTIKFLLKEKEIIKKILGKLYDKTIFVYINPDDASGLSSEDYLLILLNSLTLKMKEIGINPVLVNQLNTLELIKRNLEQLVANNIYTVFFLYDFEFLFYLPQNIFRNLESILSVNKSLINFVFLTSVNLFERKILAEFYNLTYAITQSNYYSPLFNKEEIGYIIANFEHSLATKFPDDIKKTVIELCGGHPQLLKYSFHILTKNYDQLSQNKDKIKDFLLNNYQLKNVCYDIWQNFNDVEMKIVSSVCITQKIPPTLINKSDFLLKTKIVQSSTEGHYKLFGKIFDHFVRLQIPKEKLIYDKETNQIFFGGQNYSHKFTLQEFKLLVHFIKNQNKVISRDEIGQILWGSNYVEKFSDWSIDKIISIIRKKLTEIEFPAQNLITLKRRGFSFSNPS